MSFVIDMSLSATISHASTASERTARRIAVIRRAPHFPRVDRARDDMPSGVQPQRARLVVGQHPRGPDPERARRTCDRNGGEARPEERRTRIAWVTDHTGPFDTYLDRSPGPALFRPHAWFYFFLTGPFPNEGDYARLVDDLQKGRVRPTIVIDDRHLARAGVAARRHRRPLSQAE
jgi:hypothetical protein